MGIDLGDLVPRHATTADAYRGKWVAIDAWNVLYQFLSSIRQPDGTPLMDAQGNVTSHLAGTLYRTASLVEAGVKPVFVFDGEPHLLKQETLSARSARRDAATVEYQEALDAGDEEKALMKAKQTSRLSKPMACQAMDLLEALGIPVVQAPADGEAQAAAMVQQGEADVVASQDFDCLLYGAPTLVRSLTVTGRRKLPGKQVWVNVQPEEILLQETLEASGLTRQALVDVALLIGTDFHPGIRGIGPKKALDLVKKNDGLEPLVERLAADPESAATAAERAILEQHASLAERDAVRRIFLEPAYEPVEELVLASPDADAVHELMVKTHGFAATRVDQAVERFGAARGKASQQSLFDF